MVLSMDMYIKFYLQYLEFYEAVKGEISKLSLTVSRNSFILHYHEKSTYYLRNCSLGYNISKYYDVLWDDYAF